MPKYVAYDKDGGHLTSVIADNIELAHDAVIRQLKRPENPSRHQAYLRWKAGGCWIKETDR